MAKIVKGIVAAMVTSMHDDESLNFQEIENQVNRQIAAGVDGVFCLGTNGEAYILSEDEKLRIIETVVGVVIALAVNALLPDHRSEEPPEKE